MRVLLDTPVFLWWIEDDPRLSERAREAIADEAVHVVGSSRADSDGREAVAIHQSNAATDDHVSLSSPAIFFPEIEPVGDVL